MKIKELFKKYSGKKIYTLLNNGNRGDGVIHLGARTLLNKYKVNYQEVKWFAHKDNKEIDIFGKTVFIYGCGTFCKHFHSGIDRVNYCLDRFEEIYILPSSFDTSYQPVKNFIKKLPKKVVIYCREKHSFNQIKKIAPYKENVFLDHDLAFHVDFSKWKKEGKNTLASFRRFGGESHRISFIIHKTILKIKSLFLNKITFTDASAGSDREREKLIEIISNFRKIYTDRAHGMIVGAMLGKEVFVYPDSYHKVRGIYEYSLSHFPNIYWLGNRNYLNTSFLKIFVIIKSKIDKKIAKFDDKLRLIFPKKNLLERIDHNKIPEDKKEIRLFVVGKNAEDSLPFFLDHYQTLGIDRIFYIDNNSTDKSVNFLLSRPNVHLWTQKEKYACRNKLGVSWCEQLLRKYGQDQWCLIADTDELFLFPHQEQKKINDFTKYLDNEGVDCVKCIYMDMYSDKPIEEVILKKNIPFYDICSYFDKKPPGVRSRIFKKVLYEFWGDERNLGKNYYTETFMTKHPFIKYRSEMILGPGFHHAPKNSKKASNIICTSLHFKFFSTFPSWVRDWFKKNKFNRELSYIMYNNFLIKNKDRPICFYDPEISIEYKNTQQLINLGLMSDIKLK